MRIQFRNISQGQYLNINTFKFKYKQQQQQNMESIKNIEHTFSYKKKKETKNICNIVILLLDLAYVHIIQIIK